MVQGMLSTCPHNKVCPFVVWTGAQYLGIPRTILHFSTTDVDGFFIKTSRHNQFLINIFLFFLQNADQTLQNGQIGNPR